MFKITVFSGGIGGARFLQGLRHLLPEAEVTVVTQHRRRPVGARPQGLPGPRHRDVHPGRTASTPSGAGAGARRPGASRRSSQPTAWSPPGSASATATWPPTWCARRCWRPATRSPRSPRPCAAAGSPGVRLLPMSDDRVETHVVVADPGAPSGRRVVHFQEYWIRLRAEVPAESSVFVGLDAAAPAPGVLEAIAASRPRAAAALEPGGLRRHGPRRARRPRRAAPRPRAPVVGLSPIVGGTHVRGMARQMLEADRRRGERGRRRAALRRPRRRAACSTPGSSTPATQADVARVAAGGAHLPARSR